MKSNQSRWRLGMAIFLLPLSAIGLLVVMAAAALLSLPNVDQMRRCMVTSMYQVKLCPGGGNYVTYDRIAPEVIDAVVASEDAAFFQHSGFDWYEIRESMMTNLMDHGFKRGGSTITQQLAKNVFLSRDKSIWRKIKEAALTVAIEKNYSKREILERYLNVVEFGPNLYGINAASQYYFHKAPAELHLLEASYLAFLLPNPAGYSKSYKQGQLTPFARKMLTIILRRLAGFNKISGEAMNFALTNLDGFPWAQWGRADFNLGHPQAEGPSTAEAIQKIMNEVEERPADSAQNVEPAEEAVEDDFAPDEPQPQEPVTDDATTDDPSVWQ